jgi:hypothetical protein
MHAPSIFDLSQQVPFDLESISTVPRMVASTVAVPPTLRFPVGFAGLERQKSRIWLNGCFLADPVRSQGPVDAIATRTTGCSRGWRACRYRSKCSRHIVAWVSLASAPDPSDPIFHEIRGYDSKHVRSEDWKIV